MSGPSAGWLLDVQVAERPQREPEFGEIGRGAEVASADFLEPSQPVGKGVGVDLQGGGALLMRTERAGWPGNAQTPL